VVGAIESNAGEVQADDLAGQRVERVLAAAERRVVARIQRREERAGLGDAVAEEVVRAAGAVATTRRRHRVLRCTQSVLQTVTYLRIRLLEKGSPYSITGRRVPELMPVLGSQPAGDASHKPGGRLSLLFARPAVTPVTLKRAATNFAAW